MINEGLFNYKKIINKTKRDFFIFLFISVITLSITFHFNNIQQKSKVPDNIPKFFITTQGNIRRSYRDCVIDVDYESTIAEIRIRGLFNRYLPQKEYRLQLSKNKSLLNMRKDDDWILFAMYLDYPHMRIKLAFELWRSLLFTDPTAILPDSTYVNLYINGDYQGLYLLAEKNDRKLFDLDHTTNDSDSSLIFSPYSASDLNIYESDAWDQEYPNYLDFNLIDKILPDLIFFINNTSNEQFFDPNYGVYSIFDKLNLIDFLLFNIFILHLDFWNRNYFIVRDTKPSKFYLIPWDFDWCFGQWGENFFYEPDFDVQPIINYKNKLFNRLMSNQTFMKDCKTRWFDLRENLWTEDFILDTLFEIYKEIKDSLKISMEKWELEHKLEKYVNQLFQWIPARLDYCDSYFAQI